MATKQTKAGAGPTLDQIITITGGKGVPTVGTISNNGSVEFTNKDPEVRFVQLFDQSNASHPPLFIAVPPGGTVIVTGGWNQDDQDTVCPYNVRIQGDNPRPIDTGGNKIIIGSGPLKGGKGKKSAK
jgi:hypothetical protein